MSSRGWLNLTLLVLIPLGLYVFVQSVQGRSTVLSRWAAAAGAAPQPGGLSGAADPLAGSALALPPPLERLASFNAGSQLQEEAAGGLVRFYRRGIDGGELVYFVVQLDERVHIEVINADGATPASDANGDTIWAGGGRHLATVVEMANAPYAARPGLELLGAMAFGFHGAERTSNEGSVVINGTVHRVNPGRSALCITPELTARVGLFSAEDLKGCAQAIGAGPIILWQHRIASTGVDAPTDELLPFNPLNEDFVQLAWRVKIYNGRYPKTAACVGDRPDGRSFVILVNSTGITGETLARAMRDMGCRDALGGDDDTSTQATWRGSPIWPGTREVPDAIGVYSKP